MSVRRKAHHIAAILDFIDTIQMQEHPDSPPSDFALRHFDVLVVGSINTDFVVPVPTLPQTGETILGGDLQEIGGGKGANQAVAAALLGARTAILGCVGADAFGDARKVELESYGIAVGAIATDHKRPTGAALILVDANGDNVIAVSPGANAAMAPSHVAVARALFAQAKVVVCQLEIPLDTVEAALMQARAHEMITVLNAAPGTAAARKLLPLTDVLIVNRLEAATLIQSPVESLGEAHAAAQELSHVVHRAAILTLGDEGSIVAARDGLEHIPAWQVETVDGTAAGDAFVGAVAAALARGELPRDAARTATAAAAIAVGRFGAQPSLPTGQEVAAFLESAQTTVSLSNPTS